MNRKKAKGEMEHILATQKTVTVERLKAIWHSLNFGALEGENRSLKKKIERIKKLKE